MSKQLSISLLLLALTPSFASAQTSSFSVVFGGVKTGHLVAETKGDATTVDYDYKNNGRGPTISEVIRTGPEGLPVEWSIKGKTTFGSKVEEHFSQTGLHAEWMDSSGKGSAKISKPALYVDQSGSPWSEQIFAHALSRAPGMSMAVLPGGTLHLEKGATFSVKGDGGPVEVTRYDLTGIDLNPSFLLLDAHGDLFAVLSGSGHLSPYYRTTSPGNNS
jgi:hypothetical protein